MFLRDRRLVMVPAFTVNDLLSVLEDIASFELAEAWDNVGLMVGNPCQKVTGILVALDPTEFLLDEAVQLEVNTIVTHHPLIFQPLKAIRTDQVVGRFLRKALENDIVVISCHTNLDQAAGGVNDALAAVLGLIDVQPLIPAYGPGPLEPRGGQTGGNGMPPNTGFGRIGRFPVPLTSEAFLDLLYEALDLSVVAVAGRLPDKISTMAVCGGSGSDLSETAFKKGVQVYLTGEIKHNIARWAEATDFCVIDAGHFSTEKPAVKALAQYLEKAFAEKELNINVLTSKKQKKPFTFRHRLQTC